MPVSSEKRTGAYADVIRAMRQRPSGLFSDIDGTLSPIVPVPQDAVVLPECVEAIRRLAPSIDLVCLLTGRPADEAWRMVRVDEALYMGNHGVETWFRGELMRPPGIERYHARLARSSAMLRVALANVPGLVFEDKGVGFAIHFRREPSVADTVFESARRIARRRGLEVHLRTAHVEVRVPMAGDKGTALSDVAERYGLRGLVVLGDDHVDRVAFEAARAYQAATGAAAVTIAVGKRSVLAEQADLVLEGPRGTAELLGKLATALAS